MIDSEGKEWKHSEWFKKGCPNCQSRKAKTIKTEYGTIKTFCWCCGTIIKESKIEVME